MVVSADDSPPIGLLHLDLSAAVALSPKNFTSINRTPWAGSALAKGIKRRQADSPDQRIGEAWELSCDPEAPSKLAQSSEATLSDLIACRTSECLSGSLVASGRTSCDILVKLINPAAPLSLQIHPSDDNKSLKANECGKPESWLVLAAEEGSGLYIGFSRALTVDKIAQMIQSGTFNKEYLQFVPVKPGDYFEIEAHVPHAIGPGVVLLEPQRVIAGKSGKTWRMWDWNRKYNHLGQEDAVNGSPRELHLAESLFILNPEAQTGIAYVDSLRRTPNKLNLATGVEAYVYPANGWYQTIVIRMDRSTKFKICQKACFAGLFMLDGSVHSSSQFGPRVTMQSGENYFIPAAALPNTFTTTTEGAHMALVIPAGKGVPAHGGNIF